MLLKDAKDLEYNLIGVCALNRILKSPALADALAPRLAYYAERVQTVLERCEQAVGGRVLGLSKAALPVAAMAADDSVHLLLTKITSKKDRAIATRIAMYREALGCIPLALPRSCLEPHGFVGELLLHSDEELASMASRVVQRLAEDASRRRDLLRCYGKLLTRLLAEPGGSTSPLKSKDHAAALEAMEAQLHTVVAHVTSLLHGWIALAADERVELETIDEEVLQSALISPH